MAEVGFVSCDIVGHSAVKDLGIQRRRLEAINQLVHEALERGGPEGAVWASGGDGGHTVFCGQDWIGAAADFLVKLRLWALGEKVDLRVVGHYGAVDRIQGADGRVQLVGDGINLAGRLLAQAFPQAVLVTGSFKEFLDQAETLGLLTHDPRVLRPRHFLPQLVYLLSVPGKFQSRWDKPEGGDRALLDEALGDGQAWQVIYFAKRLLQTNSQDDQAEDALDQLSPHLLVYRQQSTDGEGRVHDRLVPNPFLGDLDAETRRHVIGAAQMMERRRGEFLCQAGEAGDAMFVLLEGAVGVFPPDAASGELALEPRYVAGPGEIVGELAFTLHRPRTAALVAVEDAVLLSVHASALRAQARNNPAVAANLEKFLTRRTLEYVCNSLPYLIGPNGDGPLAEALRNKAWDRLLPHVEKIVCPLADPRPITMTDPRFGGDGLYILVSGRLRSLAYPDKVLSEADLPLVYVDLPGWVVCPDHHYRPERSDAVLLRIGKEAFLGRRPAIDAVAARLMVHLPRLYHFDTFLSYTFDDQAMAQRWREALETAGLRVYMEVATSGHYFRDRIEAGILDAISLLALISANTMTRPLEQNWVRQEIAFRQAAFEKTTAKILPVRLKGGKPELLADGYTIIDATDRAETAIAEVVETIQRTKQGKSPPPYALARKVNVKLG